MSRQSSTTDSSSSGEAKITMNDFANGPKIWRDSSTPGAKDKEANWKDLTSSMNALSFGFIATAILVSMFLIMAIFEHLLGSRASQPTSQSDAHEIAQEQHRMHSKMMKSSQNIAASNAVDFSVLMPGQLYPTYLAQPAPLPCPREGIIWPSHEHRAFASPYHSSLV